MENITVTSNEIVAFMTGKLGFDACYDFTRLTTIHAAYFEIVRMRAAFKPEDIEGEHTKFGIPFKDEVIKALKPYMYSKKKLDDLHKIISHTAAEEIENRSTFQFSKAANMYSICLDPIKIIMDLKKLSKISEWTVTGISSDTIKWKIVGE